MISKIFKIIINTVLGVLVAIGIFVVFSFVPFPGNYKVFTVQSGSMEPAIHTGSMIFVKPAAEYANGDVITKKTNDPKVTITHRIVGISEKDGKKILRTKGDANQGEDTETTEEKEVIGKMIAAIPYLGFPVSYAKTTQGLILLVIIPAVIIIYDEMNKIKMEIAKKMDYRRRVKKREEGREAGDDVAEEKIAQ